MTEPQQQAVSTSAPVAASAAPSTREPKFYSALALPVTTPSLKARLAGLALLVPAEEEDELTERNEAGSAQATDASAESEFSSGVERLQALLSSNQDSIALSLGKNATAAAASAAAISSPAVSVRRTGEPQLLFCQLPAHAPWSPSFLWKQGLSPLKLQQGLSSCDFLRAAKHCLQPLGDHDVLVGFALRHYQALNAMALQSYMLPNLFTRFNFVIDIKTALLTCAYFGQNRALWQSYDKRLWRNLVSAARTFGFNFTQSKTEKSIDEHVSSVTKLRSQGTEDSASDLEDTESKERAIAPEHATLADSALEESTKNSAPFSESEIPAQLNQRQRVLALTYLYRYLWELEPKIMSFLQRSWEMRLRLVSRQDYLVSLDDKDQLCLLYVVGYDLKLRLIKALSLSLGTEQGEIKTVVLNLELAPLLAPVSILTSERQQELNLDLSAAQMQLLQASKSKSKRTKSSNKDESAAMQSAYTSIQDEASSSAQAIAALSAPRLSAAKLKLLYGALEQIAKAYKDYQETLLSAQGAQLCDFAMQAQEQLQGSVELVKGKGFSEQELPFYQRYWLTLGKNYKIWWQLHQLLYLDGVKEQSTDTVALKYQRKKSVSVMQALSILHSLSQHQDAFGLQALCYLYENAQGSADEQTLKYYEQYVQQLQSARLGKWQQELRVMAQRQVAHNAFEQQLLSELAAIVGLKF